MCSCANLFHIFSSPKCNYSNYLVFLVGLYLFMIFGQVSIGSWIIDYMSEMTMLRCGLELNVFRVYSYFRVMITWTWIVTYALVYTLCLFFGYLIYRRSSNIFIVYIFCWQYQNIIQNIYYISSESFFSWFSWKLF